MEMEPIEVVVRQPPDVDDLETAIFTTTVNYVRIVIGMQALRQLAPFLGLDLSARDCWKLSKLLITLVAVLNPNFAQISKYHRMQIRRIALESPAQISKVLNGVNKWIAERI